MKAIGSVSARVRMRREKAHIRKSGSVRELDRDLFRRAGPQTHLPIISIFSACSELTYSEIPPRFLFQIAASCMFRLRKQPIVLKPTATNDLVVVACAGPGLWRSRVLNIPA
jgi:hypothetical protein